MAGWHLERVRLAGGVWEGRLSGPADADPPALVATWLGRSVATAAVAPRAEDGWTITLRLPHEVMADGVQTILIGPPGRDALCRETLVFGEAVEDDLRTELSLLRAELDLLKKAFRRHCAEGE